MRKKLTISLVFFICVVETFSAIVYSPVANAAPAVHYNFNPKYHFPQKWFKPPISARLSHLSGRDKSDMKKVVKKFLSKYPARMINENLRGIYFFRVLRFWNRKFGGSYWNGHILVKYDSNYNTSGYLVKALHHEFSSVLLKKHYFNVSAWTANNGGSYTSREEGKDFLLTGRDGHREKKQLFREGFVTVYGKCDWENDVNIYAEYLFARPARLKYIASKYPRVKAKVRLLKKYYCGINNNFNFC